MCRSRSILIVSSPPQKERAKNLKPQDRGRTQDEVGRVEAGVEAGRNAEGDEGRKAEGDDYALGRLCLPSTRWSMNFVGADRT